MSTPLNHFLLVFDHERAQLENIREFGHDVESAMTAYSELERKHLHKGDRYEIVLIGADSIETIKVTHANYFDGSVAVSKYFAGI